MLSIKNFICKIKGNLIYRFEFAHYGNNTVIRHPLEIQNKKFMSIGNSVYIAEYAWLMSRKDKTSAIKLFIGDNTEIGHYAHIVADNSVIIENNVLIADRVFISDCTHSYQNINVPILKQKISTLRPVVIGEETWVGEGVCVCGAQIGKHCIIGANSVVTKDIPDYCVAAGIPAKVIKKFDFSSNKWERV